MAIRGAKPTPTSLKLITGNPGHRAINRFEPRPCMAMPVAPAHLNSGAKAEWSRVCDDLARLGLLTGLDRAALAAYCQAYGRWEQAEAALTRMAERDLTTHALMIRTSNGNAVQNPLVGTANKAMADMMRYATEFGMTPSARSRIAADGYGDDDDVLAEFTN